MKNMNNYIENKQQLLLIIATLTLVIITGSSILIISSSFAPIFILAGIIGAVVLFTWLEKPVWALYFAIFIVFLPSGLIPNQINSYLNRSATVIAAAVWRFNIIKNREKIRLPASVLFMLGFILWSTISLTWADFTSEGITTLQVYILRLILFLVLITNLVKSKNDLEGLTNIIAFSGLFLVIVSLVEISLNGFTPGSRLQILNVNENDLGIKLIISIPAVLWWGVRSDSSIKPIKKWLTAIYLIVSIGLIGLSGSRGSAISLGITLFLFLFFKPTRIWGILSLFLLILAVLIAPFLFTTTIERFLGTSGELAFGGREFIWPAGWQIINEHLLTGVGIGNSPLQIIPYLKSFGVFWIGNSGESLHNPVLVIWSETGLIGLLLYLGVPISAIISFIVQFLRMSKLKIQYLMPYFALVSSTFLGYMASWIKGGGMESDFSYFLILALLLVPSCLDIGTLGKSETTI